MNQNEEGQDTAVRRRVLSQASRDLRVHLIAHRNGSLRVLHRLSVLLLLLATAVLVQWRVLRQFGIVPPWPGRQIVVSLNFHNGYLKTDLVAQSADKGSYSNVLALLPSASGRAPFETAYLYSLWSHVFGVTVSLGLAVLIVAAAAVTSNNLRWNMDLDSTKHRATVGLAPLVPVGVAAAHQLGVPATTGGWGLLQWNMLGPFGLGLLINLLAVSWTILGRNSLVQESQASAYVTQTPAIIMFGLSGYIHPVAPAIGLVLLVAILFPSRARIRQILHVAALAASGFIGIALGNLGRSLSLDRSFVETYVYIRHPHHYLPSDYVTPSSFTAELFASVVLVAYFFRCNKRQTWTRSLGLAVGMLVVPHALQYAFVERLHIPEIAAFGPSRLVYAFNILALVGGFVLARSAATRLFHKIERIIGLRRAASRLIISLLATVCVTSGFYLALERAHLEALAAFADSAEAGIYLSLIESGSDQAGIDLVGFDEQEQSALERLQIRELAGVAVFFDDYFPFTPTGADEWARRRIMKESHGTCLENLPFAQCPRPDPSAYILSVRSVGSQSRIIGNIDGFNVYMSPPS